MPSASYSPSAALCALFARAAARSIWPTGAPGLPAPGLLAGAPEVGRAAVGTGGFAGGFGAPGFAATGGGVAFGFEPTGGGGGLPASELDGLELVGVISDDPALAAAFFHGAADPFPAAIPGKTATGFALTSAATGLADMGEPLLGLGAAGGARRAGGAGAAGAALGLGGTSSR